MITVPQPSMVLNSSDVDGTPYQMWNTRLVQPHEEIGNVLDNVASVADGAYNKKLQVLIFNCHGIYRKSMTGEIGGFGMKIGTGVRLKDVDKFTKIAGKVNQIWIKACGVARIANIGRHGDGNLFCSKIAQAAQAFVIASTQSQRSPSSASPFYIEEWQGLTLCYNPKGGVQWSKDYGTPLIQGLAHGWD